MNVPPSLLKNRNIRRYLGGQLAAEVGSRITREGLPIVAILAARATAPELGILAALTTLPALLAGNLVGHWVDRTRRRPLLMGANVVRAAILMVIPLLYLVHRLTFLGIAAVTVLASLAALAIAIARHAYLPALVGRDRLEEGNEWMGTAESIGETAGPGIMGILIQGVGAPLAIAFDALANLVSAGCLLTLREVEPHPVRSDPGDVERGWAAVRSAWSRVMHHAVLRPLLLNAGASALWGGFFSTLYELYVLKTLHLNPFWLGLLITLGGLGSLVGTRIFRSIRRRMKLGPLLVLGYLSYAILNFAVPAAHGARWLAFLLLFVAQFGGDLFATVFDIGATTVEQQVTPDHWLGRVHGTFRALGGGMEVVGALIAGPLALWLSIRTTFWVATLGLLVSGLFLTARSLRTWDRAPTQFWPGFDPAQHP